ncbi:MAG: hypothetical protein ABR985_18295 [Methanotrichaceae archaeon]
MVCCLTPEGGRTPESDRWELQICLLSNFRSGLASLREAEETSSAGTMHPRPQEGCSEPMNEIQGR